MLSTTRVWQRDLRHVDDRLISEIVSRVAAKYFGGQAGELDRRLFQRHFLQRFQSWFKQRFLKAV